MRGPGQAIHHRLRGQHRRSTVAGQPVDTRLHRLLTLPVGKKLPEGDAERLRRGFQPVAWLRVRAQVKLEAAILLDMHLVSEDHCRHAAAPGRIAALHHRHAKIERAATLAAHLVGIGAINRRADIERIGVIATLFTKRIEIMQKLRMHRVLIL